MKIILSETDLLKSIKSILVEVSDAISTDFSTASMWDKNFKKGSSAEVIGRRSDDYAKKSTLETNLKILATTEAPDIQNKRPFVLKTKGKFYFANNTSINLSVIIPVDFNDGSPITSIANKVKIEELVWFYSDNNKKYESFIIDNEENVNKTGSLLGGGSLTSKKVIEILRYTIIKTIIKNLDKLELSKNLERSNQFTSVKKNALEAYKQEIINISKVISESIEEKYKEEKQKSKIGEGDNIELASEPWEVEPASASVPFAKISLKFTDGNFLFDNFKLSVGNSYRTFDDFLKHLGSSDEPIFNNEDQEKKIMGVIEKNENILRSKWPTK